MEEFILKNNPRIIEIVFQPEFILNRNLNDEGLEFRDKFLTRILKHFKYTQRTRTKEKWYTNFISEMMNNDRFRTIWIKTQTPVDNIDITNFEGKYKITSPKENNLQLYLFTTSIVGDPRFNIELHTPADNGTFKYFK